MRPGTQWFRKMMGVEDVRMELVRMLVSMRSKRLEGNFGGGRQSRCGSSRPPGSRVRVDVTRPFAALSMSTRCPAFLLPSGTSMYSVNRSLIFFPTW